MPSSDWENKFTPKLDGKPIALKDHERSRSLAIAPDASRFVLGTEWYAARLSRRWQQAVAAKPAPGIAWGVNISGDGRLVVAAYSDGTIRWHRMSDGKELLALFVHAKDKRYIAWTPKGYYAASPGAEDLIGWHVNRDWDHAADFFPASRFRDQYNRPDIVKRVLDDLDEDKAIAEANRLAGAKPAEDIANSLPPVVTLLSPTEGNTFSADSLHRPLHPALAVRPSSLRGQRARGRPSAARRNGQRFHSRSARPGMPNKASRSRACRRGTSPFPSSPARATSKARPPSST